MNTPINTRRGIQLGNLILDDDDDLWVSTPEADDPEEEARITLVGPIGDLGAIEARARRLGFDFDEAVELASYAGVSLA